jgi:hypothetical protein
MTRKYFIIIGILSVALFLLGGCSGERGLKGDAGTADCVQCHSDNTQIVSISHQWEHSVHATGGNFERNTTPCANCHTSEGFVQYLATGDGGVPENPSSIGCFTCHEPHTNKNFNLRTQEPVALELSTTTYDKGISNLCANCHHGRALSPAITETTTLTSNRWGPHHGTQADILTGTGAYLFAGETYRNSQHTTQVTNGCPTCHMQDAYGVQAGGHTMNMTYDSHGTITDRVVGCNTADCHNGELTSFNYDESQDSVEVLLESLREELVAASILDGTTGLPNASSGTPLVLTADHAGALYNFLFFEDDRSLGVHNTKYAYDALIASINAVAPTE